MIVDLAIVAFGITGLAAGVRLVRGPSLVDRILALDVALISLMAAIAADASRRGEAFLDLLVVISIVGFTATVTAARFVENQADQR